MEHVVAPDEWETYQSALCSSSAFSCPFEQVVFYAELGWAYRLFLDVCSYVYASLKGQAPSPKWRENYYIPGLMNLEEIHHKMMEYST